MSYSAMCAELETRIKNERNLQKRLDLIDAHDLLARYANPRIASYTISRKRREK